MPPKWFWAHVQMMRRIEAEEALSLISQIATGNGLMERSDQRTYLDGLRRTAHGGRLPRAEAANAASLAQIGISVTTEPTSDGGVVLPPGVDLSQPEDPKRARVAAMAAESDRRLEQIDREMEELSRQ